MNFPRRAQGFTLIEILAALLVLAIGLTSVISLLFFGRRMGNTTVDRNIAQMIITKAVADIERAHLITANMTFQPPQQPPPPLWPTSPPSDDVGLLIETVAGTANPNIHSILPQTPYAMAVIVPGKTIKFYLDNYCQLKCFGSSPLVSDDTNTLLWPLGNDPEYVGGMSNTSSDPQALAYRVIYRLERHPQWSVDNEGMYVLTLVVYRDMDRKGGRLEQVTDPVVVYLRDKKIR